MRKLHITEIGTPLDSDLNELRAGLRDYNHSQTSEYLYEQVACFVKAEDGTILGGASGLISWAWLHIELLWCHESIRMNSYGSKLVSAMESHAIKKGAEYTRVETADFQALEFYKKHHYKIYAELPNCPPGHMSYFLKKKLKL